MNLQIINAVWGEKYIDTFLQLSLPTQFSSGNLKDLKLKSSYIIYTDEAGKSQIIESPIFKKLKKYSNVIFRLIKINQKRDQFDILLQCHSNALKEANKISAPIVLLSPDCILSINVFSYLENAVNQGTRLLVICSARMSLEKYKEIIQEKEGSLLPKEVYWASQDLAKTTIKNLHHRGRCLIMDAKTFPSLPSQMYWKLDENNLLAKAYHLHPLLMWPEVHKIYPTNSADGKNFLEKICPNFEKWKVIEDCKEISLFEISSDKQFTTDKRVPINLYAFRRWLSESVSEAHLQFIKYNIVLGDSIRKSSWEKTITEANKFISELSKQPKKNNLNSSQNWLYSIKNFFKWHFLLVYQVITGNKKLKLKKLYYHFYYLIKYKALPLEMLEIGKKQEKQKLFSLSIAFFKKLFEITVVVKNKSNLQK